MEIVFGLGVVLVLFACLFAFGMFNIKASKEGKGEFLGAIIVTVAFFGGIVFCWVLLDSLGMIVH